MEAITVSLFRYECKYVCRTYNKWVSVFCIGPRCMFVICFDRTFRAPKVEDKKNNISIWLTYEVMDDGFFMSPPLVSTRASTHP